MNQAIDLYWHVIDFYKHFYLPMNDKCANISGVAGSPGSPIKPRRPHQWPAAMPTLEWAVPECHSFMAFLSAEIDYYSYYLVREEAKTYA